MEPSPAEPGVAQSGSNASTSESAEGGKPSGAGIQVLVVEDDALLANTVSDLLVLEGYSVSLASDVAQVEQRVAEIAYNVILTDVSIGGGAVSESEYFSQLRTWAPGAAIVAMTGNMDTLQSTAQELGLEGLISKPFEIEELMQTIRAVSARRARASRPDS